MEGDQPTATDDGLADADDNAPDAPTEADPDLRGDTHP